MACLSSSKEDGRGRFDIVRLGRKEGVLCCVEGISIERVHGGSFITPMMSNYAAYGYMAIT